MGGYSDEFSGGFAGKGEIEVESVGQHIGNGKEGEYWHHMNEREEKRMKSEIWFTLE